MQPTELINHWDGAFYVTHKIVAPGESYIHHFATAKVATVMIHAGGSSAFVEVSISPVSNWSGQPRFAPSAMGVGGVITDASEPIGVPEPIRALRVTAGQAGPVIVEVLQS